MSVLHLLYDLAGCRAVLHDARIEAEAVGEAASPVVAALEVVLQDAEDAVWEGGEVEVVEGSRHRRTLHRLALDRNTFVFGVAGGYAALGAASEERYQEWEQQ